LAFRKKKLSTFFEILKGHETQFTHMDTKLKFLGTYKNLYRFYYFQNDPLITGEGMRGCNSDNWTDTMVLSIVIPLRMLAFPFLSR
jgi:hypothetical protein